jgi:hypothetical protein
MWPRLAPSTQQSSIRTLVSLVLLAASMLCRPARAETDCSERLVALKIDATAIDVPMRQRLERQVATELQSNNLGLCLAPSAPKTLAEVYVLSASPELERALIGVQLHDGALFERAVDVSDLPAAARGVALATAVDELLRSALTVRTHAQPPELAVSQPPQRTVLRERAEGLVAEAHRRESPLFEIGIGGGASAFVGEWEAITADLLARWWLQERVALLGRAGVAARLSRPAERGIVQARTDQHAALGLGYECIQNRERVGLIAHSMLQVSRVRFDKRDDERPITFPLDHGWSVTSTWTIEGSFRAGSFGASAALSALLPLKTAKSDWGNTTFPNVFGVEGSIGVWMAVEALLSPSSGRGPTAAQ